MTETTTKQTDSGFLEILKVIAQALVIAVIIRTLLFQPFSIPSGSMKSTLLVGDYLFVAKYAYGYSHFSIPFSPDIFSGRILAGKPKRGDVVVFKLPTDDKTDYIKRLIGLPGDRIQMQQDRLYINGKIVPRTRVADFVETESNGQVVHVPRYRETLPNGVSYTTLDLTPNGYLDNTEVYEVPPNHYFMMGDNRDNSSDSRVLSEVGYVPFENLIGRAEIIFFSVKPGQPVWAFWDWPWDVRWNRIFNLL